jgi:hypothetical protein
MGKGKGSLSRYCSRTYTNHNIFEFIGFNLKELFLLKTIFKKKVNIPLKIGGSFFLNKHYHIHSKSENFFFFKKYNQ